MPGPKTSWYTFPFPTPFSSFASGIGLACGGCACGGGGGGCCCGGSGCDGGCGGGAGCGGGCGEGCGADMCSLMARGGRLAVQVVVPRNSGHVALGSRQAAVPAAL